MSTLPTGPLSETQQAYALHDETVALAAVTVPAPEQAPSLLVTAARTFMHWGLPFWATDAATGEPFVTVLPPAPDAAPPVDLAVAPLIFDQLTAERERLASPGLDDAVAAFLAAGRVTWAEINARAVRRSRRRRRLAGAVLAAAAAVLVAVLLGRGR